MGRNGTRPTLWRWMTVVTTSVLMLLAIGSPALAADGVNRKDQVVLSGQVIVPSGERVRNVVVFHGPVRVAGDVQGSVVVFDGSVQVSGSVRDNVVAFHGPVTLAEGARVGGDVLSRQRPSVAPGATVAGRIKKLNVELAPSFVWLGLAFWLAYGLSVLILGLLLVWLAPRALDAVHAAGVQAPGPSVGWGLALFIGLPVVAVLALATLVGIPLGIALLLALLLIYATGYAASMWILGRTLLKPPRGRATAFLVGWVIVEAATLIPFLGGVVWFAAAVFGLGAMIVAVWRARRVLPVVPAPAIPPMPVG
jgi:cytoskeletal protein CcmA (bactofilin family)